MDTTERIHNAIEWANKRLILQGQELSQEQKNYLTFALSQNFTDNNQALQLQQTGVSGQLPPLQLIDKERKKLMKALYPKDNSKCFRR